MIKDELIAIAQRAGIEMDEQLEGFARSVERGTKDPDQYPDFTQFENLFLSLNLPAHGECCGMMSEMLSALDTRELNASIKKRFLEKGIRLINKGIRSRNILTLQGEVKYRRTMYVPADPQSAELLDHDQMKAVYPLDMALGIDRLPFKISPQMMLDIAKRAVNASSYDELQSFYRQDRGIVISDDQIRLVTNCIGKMVYEQDCARRDAALEHLCQLEAQSFPSSGKRGKDVLYIVTDEAKFITRGKGNDSPLDEIKLGMVFSSRNLKHRKNGDVQIKNCEYIGFIGPSDVFGQFLYAAAQRNGLEEHGKTVILGDGADWMKNFTEIYCKGLDVTHILDYSRLRENVSKLAQESIPRKNRRTRWAGKLCALLREGQTEEALAMAEVHKDVFTYLSNNRDCIDYPRFFEAGYLIDSGKGSTMEERLRLPMMRWNPASAQYVLSARMKYDSGKWTSEVVPLLYQELKIFRRKT